MTDSNILYFGYGSNLNTKDLTTWLKKRGYATDVLVPVGTAYLPDRELAFTRMSKDRGGGVLDVPLRRGSRVHGVLFQVQGAGWEALDKKEGVKQDGTGAYERVRTVALSMDGSSVPVITYAVREEERSRAHVTPSETYREIVREGRAAWGLDDDDDRFDLLANGGVWPDQVDTLFVYGTLMRGETRASLLGAERLKTVLLASARGQLHVLGEYPGFVPSPEGTVRGEWIQLQDHEAILAVLDDIEGFLGFGSAESLFERRLVEVDLGRMRTRTAWTYVPRSTRSAPMVASGSWRRHRGTEQLFLERLATAHLAGDKELERQVTERVSWPYGDPSLVLAGGSLAEALELGRVSERELAQVSGKWAVVPDAAPSGRSRTVVPFAPRAG